MVALMKDRFTGGMEKQSTTLKGIWSTVTGTAKSAMSSIVGITTDGSIKQGSIYEKLKSKIKSVADMFEKWQKDGTIDRIADQVTNTVSKAIEYLGNAVKWLKDNMNWLVPVASGLLATFVAFNVISKVAQAFSVLSKVIKGVTAATSIFNFVLSMNPIGLIALGIGVLIGVGVLLWKNWDTVKLKASELWKWLSGIWTKIRTSTENAFNGMGSKIVSFIKTPINSVVSMVNKLIDGINSISFSVPDWVPGLGGKTFGVNIPNIPAFALGTSYFKGGLARINERGGEIVNLPNGSQVIPKDKSAKLMNNNKNVTVQINVQGNLIGDEENIHRILNKAVPLLKLQLSNM